MFVPIWAVILFLIAFSLITASHIAFYVVAKEYMAALRKTIQGA